ncbi:MFS transporter [Rhodococcus sp. USK13]|uniref:MFS transporter n=1 Tax=Rhodococcus sp. USK13 TaxID=2806442 RepID=UPI001BCB9AE9|nr:MFS transporter [Rhodococcus sp. USK13]
MTIVLCFIAVTVEGFDMQSGGVAAPGMAAHYDLESGALGLVLAGTPIGLLFGTILGGRSADLVGRKTGLMWSLGLFGVFSLASAFAPSFELLLLFRFLTGLGLGGAMPNLIALAAEASGRKSKVNFVVMAMIGLPFGGMIAATIGLLVANIESGWRAIFVIGGVAPLIVAGIVFFALRESQEFEMASVQGPKPSVHEVLFSGGRGRTTILLGLAFFCTLLVIYLLQNWLPTLMVSNGFSRQESGKIQICLNGGSVLGAIVIAYTINRISRKGVIAATFAGAASSLLVLSGMGNSIIQAALLTGIVGAFIAGSQLLLYAMAPTFYDTLMRGTGVGATTAMGRLGAAVGPLAVIPILGGGGGTSTVLLAILPVIAVAGTAAFLLTSRPQLM